MLLFGKTREANRSLARQFEGRSVEKTYTLRTDRSPGPLPRIVRSRIEGAEAETEFRLLTAERGHWLVEAQPVTGRTHQVRVHARDAGFPILGDERYGGSPFSRLCLHAQSLQLAHPVDNAPVRAFSPADFDADPEIELRERLWPAPATTAWRLLHRGANREPFWAVDRFGDYLLSQSERAPTSEQIARLARWRETLQLRAAYHKTIDRRVRAADAAAASPIPLFGEAAPERFEVCENGIRFWVSFTEGCSVGLFLDQRENRRRLGAGYIFPGTPKPLAGASVLNTFAYTCSFSVAAAFAGAKTTSLDLSKKALEWGRENFSLNELDPAAHDFIYGDCFEWMKRLAKKERRFDFVVLDPPTFSRSKRSGVFRVEKNYDRLVAAALPLLAPGGVLFCSSNSATLAPDAFTEAIHRTIEDAGRSIEKEDYVPQPPDFPTGSGDPGYLKTLWLAVK